MTYMPTTVVGQRLYSKLLPWADEPGDLARLCDSIGYMAEPLAEILAEQGEQGEPGWVPPYGKVMNPAECPAAFLPWLAMFVGVQIPVGVSEAEARALIKAESGLARGTEASVKAAIERSISRFWAPDTEYLKGQLVRHESNPGELLCYEVTATFTSGATFATTNLSLVNIATQYELISREKANGETNAYYFTVLCHPQQVLPEGSLKQMEANVNGVKPAGLVPEYVLTEEPLQTDPYIDEFSREIEAIEGEIETLTLAQVT